jgi:hypothetical protein
VREIIDSQFQFLCFKRELCNLKFLMVKDMKAFVFSQKVKISSVSL